jgi:2,4-dichlorophenol 6-monooxygenase
MTHKTSSQIQRPFNSFSIWLEKSFQNGISDGKVVNPYSSERIPVARANALQSFVNASRWWPFMKSAVELMSHISSDDDAAIEAGFQSFRVKAVLQERIEYNRPHFDSFDLQLGYVYEEGDGTELKDNFCLLIPSAKGGARLPHVWLGNGLSILDFVSDSEFTLLLSQNNKLGEVGFDTGGIKITTHDVDVDKLEATAAWKCLVEISEKVGLHVRPDQHVLGHASSLEEVVNLLSRYL